MNTNDVNIDKLVNDLKVVVRDAEGLLRVTAGEVGESARAAREKLGAALESAKVSCEHLEKVAMENARAADRLVRRHPYESLGLAFGAGILLGVLFGRK